MKKHSALVNLVTTAALGLFLSTAVHAATLEETKTCYTLGDLGANMTIPRDAGIPIAQARSVLSGSLTMADPILNDALQLYSLRLLDAVYQAPLLTSAQVRTIVEADCFKTVAAAHATKLAPAKRSPRY